MNSPTVEPATLNTIEEMYFENPARRAELAGALRERIASGTARAEDFLLLRGADGAVLAWANTAAPPFVPFFPSARPEVSATELQPLLAALRAGAEPPRRLLLDDGRCPLHREAALAAGWVFESEELLYERSLTDLGDLPELRLPPGVELRELPETEREDAAVGELLALLNEEPPEGEGWRTWGLVRGGVWLALGSVGGSNRAGTSSISLTGVHPQERGQGLGAALHAELLRRAAAAGHTTHAGITGADNAAMRAVYRRSGCAQVGRQLYFSLS